MSVRDLDSPQIAPNEGRRSADEILPAAWVYLAGGLCWLSLLGSGSWILAVLAFVPGLGLVGCGVAALRSVGSRRVAHCAALVAAIGLFLTLPLLLTGEITRFLLLIVASALCFAVAGRASAIPDEDGAVPPEGPALCLHAGADAAILGSFHATLRPVPLDELARIRDELATARAMLRSAGQFDRPADFHREPPGVPEPVSSKSRRAAGLDFEHLSAMSRFHPDGEFPGAARWEAQPANQTTHAWCLRRSSDAPWLICVHGFGLGRPPLDFRAMAARWLHRDHGYNLLFPVLALHGPRARGWVSGDGFLSGDPLDTLHAVAQSVYDIRHWLGWAAREAPGPPAIFGVSLGAYHAALVASLDRRVGRVLLGTPLVDIEETLWLHGPPHWQAAASSAGVFREDVRDLLRVISPLAFPAPTVPSAMFVAEADRLIAPGQAPALARHWPGAAISQLPSAHVTYRLVSELRGALATHLPGTAAA